jgi:hypothetical protein
MGPPKFQEGVDEVRRGLGGHAFSSAQFSANSQSYMGLLLSMPLAGGFSSIGLYAMAPTLLAGSVIRSTCMYTGTASGPSFPLPSILPQLYCTSSQSRLCPDTCLGWGGLRG